MACRPLPLLAALALAGCASDDTVYPSLQPRAVERVGFAEPALPIAVVEPDPALDRQIADASTTLDHVGRGSDESAARAAAQVRAARSRPAGSEAWLDAQVALAALDDWRAQTSTVVTDLDRLAIERGTALAPPYPALVAARERAVAELDRQTRRIAELSGSLAPA